MSEKVKIISSFNGRCGIDNADLRISRRWPGRGSVVVLDKEVVEELMYDVSFKNMIEDGTLYIEDMKVKKELGIEPEDATAPTIIFLDDAQLDRFWRIMPFAQFKAELNKLTAQQLQSLADYAIKHGEDGSITKANLLTQITKKNVLKGIELQKSLEG